MHYPTGFFCSLIFLGKHLQGKANSQMHKFYNQESQFGFILVPRLTWMTVSSIAEDFFCPHYIQKPIQHEPHFVRAAESQGAVPPRPLPRPRPHPDRPSGDKGSAWRGLYRQFPDCNLQSPLHSLWSILALHREQKRVQAMAMLLQQEEQEIADARKEVKRMLELHKKTTTSLAALEPECPEVEDKIENTSLKSNQNMN